MAGPQISTEALVLRRDPPAESFQRLTLLSPEHGRLFALQRLPRKTRVQTISADLFDHIALALESRQGSQTWFVKELRLLTRPEGIGRHYAKLAHAAEFAQLLARNPGDDTHTWVSHFTLGREALVAFGRSARPDLIGLKSLYRFARDEGYPVREQWFGSLPPADRAALITALNQPADDQDTPPEMVDQLHHRLTDYLRGHTDILVD